MRPAIVDSLPLIDFFVVLLDKEHREHDVQRAQEPRTQNIKAKKLKHVST